MIKRTQAQILQHLTAQQHKADSHLFRHFFHSIHELVHYVTDLQCLVRTVVVEVLILILRHALGEL